MRNSKWARILLWCLYGLLAIAVIGTWFHTSDERSILGKYSTVYFVEACLATLGGVVIGFAAWLVLTPQQFVLTSGRTVTISLRTKLLGVLSMAVLGSVVAEIALTNRKEKQLGPRAELAGFHPYLQNVPVPSDRKMSINRWGFRGEEIDLAKPDGTYRIFVLGGSTVFCGEVDFEQTHCRLMEKKLRQAYPGVKIEVQNAGVPWHTSQHSLIKFLTKVEDFQPDLVIIYHGINDLCRGFSPPYASVGEYQPDYSHFYGPVATMVRTYAEDRGRFHLYVLDEAWTFLARQWFSDIRGTAESDPPVVVKPWNEWKSLPSFKRNLGNLALVLRAKQIELVMASQPYLLRDDLTAEERRKMKVVANLVRNQYEQPDVASIRSGMETFNRTAKAVADEYGAVFVDLEKCVPKAVDYFVDDFHYTPDGNRLVCEALTDAVIMNGFVDKKFPREK